MNPDQKHEHERQRFAAWVQQARQERIPPLDVSARVTQSLEAAVRARADDWSLWIASALSVAAALTVLADATYLGVWSNDPLVEFLQPLAQVMQ
jgi:hypothetical protein